MPSLTKHIAGWLNADNMNREWLQHWRERAIKAGENGNQLIVFEVPKGPEGSRLLSAIEAFIQSELGND